MSFSNQDYSRGAVANIDRADERSISVIDQYSTFDGTFIAERDLRIDGTVNGTIECQGTLFVAEGATVNARIQAENITVAGDLTGEIDCRGRLRLLPSGILKAKVRTRALVIAQGAVYDGDLTMESAPAVAAVSQEPPAQTAPTQAPRTSRPTRPPSRPASESAAPSSAEPAAPSTFIRRLGGPETPWDEQAAGESEQASAGEE